MIVRDEDFNDDGYLNPLVMLPGVLHPSATAPATIRPALLCLGRGWIRIGSNVLPVVELWGTEFDDRPCKGQRNCDELVDELWLDTIGG